ncbi:adenylyltransferase/cytidyltransferase family protein [Candidatus Dojkabacteria bacterium]|nr:adenylyltransferase/cytidyltransferase family protein [Candidatus Dojkabacteria bacterium]
MFYRNQKIIQPDFAVRKFSKKNNLVFTSGVYDILHIGHIKFLRAAKNIVKNDGHLLVAIHEDEFVKQVKGPDRPYTKTNERLEILSELICVDYAVSWSGWESIVSFTKRLKPKYFAITDKNWDHSRKGNWKAQTWDEVAEEINTEIVQIPLYKNYSSSKIINKENGFI